MRGTVIGKTLNHGYAGWYSRQPDMIIDAHPLGGSEAVVFGTPLVYGADGSVVAFSSANTAADFVGVASREIKSAVSYLGQNTGQYQPSEAVSVLKRGCINAKCAIGTPALGKKVYIRIAANENKPGPIGGFEASADGSNTIELTNCEWRGEKDVNGIAEIVIKTMNRA